MTGGLSCHGMMASIPEETTMFVWETLVSDSFVMSWFHSADMQAPSCCSCFFKQVQVVTTYTLLLVVGGAAVWYGVQGSQSMG